MEDTADPHKVLEQSWHDKMEKEKVVGPTIVDDDGIINGN